MDSLCTSSPEAGARSGRSSALPYEIRPQIGAAPRPLPTRRPARSSSISQTRRTSRSLLRAARLRRRGGPARRSLRRGARMAGDGRPPGDEAGPARRSRGRVGHRGAAGRRGLAYRPSGAAGRRRTTAGAGPSRTGAAAPSFGSAHWDAPGSRAARGPSGAPGSSSGRARSSSCWFANATGWCPRRRSRRRSGRRRAPERSAASVTSCTSCATGWSPDGPSERRPRSSCPGTAGTRSIARGSGSMSTSSSARCSPAWRLRRRGDLGRQRDARGRAGPVRGRPIRGRPVRALGDPRAGPLRDLAGRALRVLAEIEVRPETSRRQTCTSGGWPSSSPTTRRFSGG